MHHLHGEVGDLVLNSGTAEACAVSPHARFGLWAEQAVKASGSVSEPKGSNKRGRVSESTPRSKFWISYTLTSLPKSRYCVLTTIIKHRLIPTVLNRDYNRGYYTDC